jgi:hypothetical protein
VLLNNTCWKNQSFRSLIQQVEFAIGTDEMILNCNTELRIDPSAAADR